jgi:hypothetical protein
MKEERLTRWLKRGYPYFKEGSGLPSYVVPEHTFNRLADELGDESILELCQPLHFADGIDELAERCPDPEAVPAEVWRTAVELWPVHTHVKPTADTCLNAARSLLRQYQEGSLSADPVTVCRGLAVLGYAPFVPAGKSLVKELDNIFEGDTSRPTYLLKQYMKRVGRGDTAFIEQVDDCISKHPDWMDWSERFLQCMRGFPYTPKPVGVTPPMSGELVVVLAQMIKEATKDDEPGRHHPEHPEGEIGAE